MNVQVIVVLALAAAGICSGWVLLTLPMIAGAALRGNIRGMLRTTGLAIVLTALALAAFALVGVDASGYFGRV